jgi:hypothetical protein
MPVRTTRSAISGVITSLSHFPQVKTVMGTPQARWRDTHQSGRFSIMPVIRSRPQAGIQVTREISSRVRRRSPPASIGMNH